MKKHSKLVSIITVCIIFGVIIGIQLNTIVGGDSAFLHKEIEIQELTELKKTTEDIKERITSFKNRVEELEKERADESVPLKKLKLTVDEYKSLAGYSAVSGPGIIIVLESNMETNIAEVMEGKRYLINLINELKIFGAEVLSINNYRVVGRTEVTLAGNHINVNGTSIAQPYIIQAIGDQDSFRRYIEHGTILFELMKLDGITSNIKFSDNVKIFPLSKEKPLEFLRVVDE
ncbi:MAG: DUF881 domain-containing protein [Candidatus Alkaliphilus sp. MAG34]|nr:DUF881 domain-containing protein [Clostridiales bacterium]